MVRTPPGIAAAARLCKQILVPSALAARWRPAHSLLMLTLHPRRLLDAAIGSHVQNGANAAEMGLAGAAGVLPPQYVNFKETTRSEMLEIKAKMGELRKLHGQVGLCVFQGPPQPAAHAYRPAAAAPPMGRSCCARSPTTQRRIDAVLQRRPQSDSAALAHGSAAMDHGHDRKHTAQDGNSKVAQDDCQRLFQNSDAQYMWRAAGGADQL